MNPHLALLQRWRRRTGADRTHLARTLLIGVAANVVSSGLLVGTMTLLTYSAGQPTWRSIALWLLLVELIAFLRSPLRFAERVTRHDLGLAAVTQWRLWLLRTAGRWPISSAPKIATGDLLDRALSDTDELQNLWVRGLLPLLSVGVTLVLVDLVFFFLPAVTSLAWFGGLVAIQVAAALFFGKVFLLLAQRDRVLRRERGHLHARLVGVEPAWRELSLLGADEFIDQQLAEVTTSLNAAERRAQRLQRLLPVVATLTVLATVAVIGVAHSRVTPSTLVAVIWLALALGELLSTCSGAIESLVASVASAERLEELETPHREARGQWRTAPLRLRSPSGKSEVALPPGRRLAVTGPSGSGKTTYLQGLAALREEDSPLLLDGVSVSSIEEETLRRHLRYVSAEPGLLNGYLRDVVRPGEAAPPDAWEQLQALGIIFAPDDLLEDLSRGERQRIAVVRALSTNPSIVVLDEPTSGLGSADTQRLLALLASSGVTVIVATHDPLVVEWCDEVLRLPAP